MLAPGSYLALVDSVSTGRAHREAAQRYAQTGTVLYQRRGPEQIKGFLAWVTLIDHGAVPVSDWRPDPSPFPPALAGTLGGVGRKAAG
jgi:hypothetical protein